MSSNKKDRERFWGADNLITYTHRGKASLTPIESTRKQTEFTHSHTCNEKS